MIYRLFLISILISLSISSLAGEKRYRVEILVLTQLQHEAVPAETESLRDFSSALDFLKAEEEEEDRDNEENPAGEEGSERAIDDSDIAVNEMTDEENTEGINGESPLDEDQPELPWAGVIPVEDKGDSMLEAWRRLRLSAPFRPEQYLSWEQSADEPFPLLRIHDLEVILIDDPYAELRGPKMDQLESDESGEVPDVVDMGIESGSVDSEEEPGLPDPTLYYRLDGTVMLRRSRFLHLDLDLELRQAIFDDQPLAAAPIGNTEDDPVEPEPPLPTSFLVHDLKQSRQVKSQRMEYFDSPVLGVLLWITPFELEDATEEPSG